jgi:hypothetical protein
MEVRMALFRSSLKIVLVLFLFASPFISAQLDFNWTKGYGSTGPDLGRCVTTDAQGNIFYTGDFQNTINFPGGVSMTSQGNYDYFLVKFDKTGTALWKRTAGSGVGSYTERGYGVKLDHSGNIITAGHLNRTTTWEGGSNPPVTITAAGVNLDGFVAKYTSAGDLSWVKSVTGVSQISARKIAIDQNNNIICNGYYGTSSGNDTANFFGVIPTLHSVGSSRDWYIVKYDSNGTALWARSAGGALSDEPADVVVDGAGYIYVCGFSSKNTTYFGSINLACDSTDAVVAKYSPNGDICWAKNFGGKKVDQAYGLVLDGLGNLYVSGNFDSAAVFGSLGTVFSNGGLDAFLLKMDTTGTPIWIQHGGGTSTTLSEIGYKAEIDKSGNIWMCGTFQGTATFGASSVTSAGGIDIFIAQYDPSGNLLFLKRAGGTDTDQAWYLCIEPSGNVLVGGNFRANPDFGTTNLTTAGGDDLFLSEIGGRALTLTAFLEGVTNAGGTAMRNDFWPITVTVELHDGSTLALVESKTGVLSTAGVGTFIFTTAVNGTPYYIVVKSDNSIETWSAAAQSFTSNALSYNFASAQTQAYGSNMIQKGSGAWCIFSGDVSKDATKIVDGSDVIAIDNDNTYGITTSAVTDITGDGIVDGSDVINVDNNNTYGISRQAPPGAPVARRVVRPGITQKQDIK